MPTPRNTVLETARGKASKDATRSLRFGCCCCCVSPLTRSFGFRCSFLLCEEETPQLYSLFFHDGRQGPRPTHPQRFERKPSSIPGDIQGPPYLSPSLDREPDPNFCLAQDREWVSSRSHSEGLLQAEARAREGVGAHWMRVFFPKRPQSWDTRLAAESLRDGQKSLAGCKVPWRWLEQALGCSRGSLALRSPPRTVRCNGTRRGH